MAVVGLALKGAVISVVVTLIWGSSVWLGLAIGHGIDPRVPDLAYWAVVWVTSPFVCIILANRSDL